MYRWFVAFALLVSLPLLFVRSARAELPGIRIPLRTAVVTPLPRAVRAAPFVPPAVMSLSTTIKPVDNSFLGRVAHLLDGMKPPAPARGTKDSNSRYPTITDPARERDATSFGIQQPAPIKAAGAAMAAGGLGAAGAQMIDLGKVTKALPFRVGPSVFQGGGGLSIKTPW